MSLFKKIGLSVWCFFMLLGQVCADDILPADKVFIPTITSVTDSQIRINIDIKEKYYLYRQRLFSVTSDDNIAITDVKLSEGIDKTDAFFGTQSVWYGGKNTAEITLDYDNLNNNKSAEITVKYQGCQDGVICYPPQKIKLSVTLPIKVVEKPATKDLFAKKSSPLFGGKKETELLKPEQAFPFDIEFIDDTTLAIRWRVADGYYLYRDKINTQTPNVAEIKFSNSETHYDDFYGEQAIYRHDNGVAHIYLTEKTLTDKLSKQFLHLTFQGCADKGICYPVMKHQFTIGQGKIQTIEWNTDDISNIQSANKSQARKSNSPTATDTATDNLDDKPLSVIDKLTQTLSNNMWLGFALLLLAGVALSFTPCVLPMLPILLGIITNQNKVSKSKAALLSSSYALGVAVMMSVFGLIVAKTGINLQIVFQKPIWLIVFASIFMLMGLAMLGVFSLAMPNGVQNKIFQLQNRFQDSKPSNLFIVGALSTLGVGPCVAPPLIAILAFIATTDNSVLGALYLFALGLGMSLPLVIFATVVTTVPKTGAFSKLLTKIFALLMFGVGLWLLSRLLSGSLALILWGVLMFALSWVLWRSEFVQPMAKKVVKSLSVVSLLIGLIWAIGGAMGNANPLKPFTKVTKLSFQSVSNVDELNQAIGNSKNLVMLDVYADWCVSCQELEHITFAEPAVADELNKMTLLKLDITDTDDAQRKLLAELNLIGPPALLFFKDGKEVGRQIGVIGADELLLKLQQMNE